MTALPVDWRSPSLDEIADIRPGRTPKTLDRYLTENPRQGRTVPFYKVGDMNAHPSDLRVARTYLAPGELVNLGVSVLPVDSIVFPKAGGAIATNKKRRIAVPGAVDLNCMAVVPHENVDARYLRAWFESLDLTSLADGSVLPQISKKTVSALTIPLPGLAEQRRIVDILEDHLSRLDAAIGGLQLALTRSTVLERAIIDDVFIRRADAEDWPVVRLEELAAPERRSMTDGPFGSNLTSAHYAVSGARVVRLQNIGDGEYRAADAFISLDHYDTLRSHDVRGGDVVVASLGDLLPRAAVVPDLDGPAIVKADCIRIRPQAGLDPAWIALACRSTRAKRWAEARVHGVGRQRLGMKGIRDIPVPFPSDTTTREEAIAEIGSEFESLRRLSAAIESARSRGEILRKSLLAAAFSGRLTGRSADMEMVEEMADV